MTVVNKRKRSNSLLLICKIMFRNSLNFGFIFRLQRATSSNCIFVCKQRSPLFRPAGGNFINILRAHFLYERAFLVPKCHTNVVHAKISYKKCAQCVDEIDGFTYEFFVWMSFRQLYSSNILALVQVQKHFCTKNSYIICWWNWHQVLFQFREDIYRQKFHRFTLTPI